MLADLPSTTAEPEHEPEEERTRDPVSNVRPHRREGGLSKPIKGHARSVESAPAVTGLNTTGNHRGVLYDRTRFAIG